MVTSNGITAASHASLPFALRPLYAYLVASPHLDKLGAERVLARSAGLPWAEEDVVEKAVLPDGWEGTEGLPDVGDLKKVVIVRPALLTDGDCRADSAKDGKAPYRVQIDGNLKNAYRVSRKDIAHFIVDDAIPHWEKYEGKGVCVSY